MLNSVFVCQTAGLCKNHLTNFLKCGGKVAHRPLKKQRIWW